MLDASTDAHLTRKSLCSKRANELAVPRAWGEVCSLLEQGAWKWLSPGEKCSLAQKMSKPELLTLSGSAAYA